jgi:hypothetical protein
VAGALQLGHRKTGDGAAAFTVGEQARSEHVLAHALNDEALGLGGARERIVELADSRNFARW